MKENRSERKKMNVKSFYTALCICFAMIGFACYFAYTQTAGKLENQLDSIGDNAYIAEETTSEEYNEVIGIQTSIPKDENHDFYIQTEIQEETVLSETDIPLTETAEPVQTESLRKPMQNTSYIMPAEGTVICEFSNGELVKSNTTGAWQTHNGIDIAVENGTQIYSMSGGTVTEVTNDALWGICVLIDHGNGISARYCGLAKDLSVEAGSEVNSGTIIGMAGNTCEIECESEPHIHFEVIKNGSYISPLEFINGI
jgi:murein DD-endopeptidase MepM/ murein hydrolase activator NlpD